MVYYTEVFILSLLSRDGFQQLARSTGVRCIYHAIAAPRRNGNSPGNWGLDTLSTCCPEINGHSRPQSASATDRPPNHQPVTSLSMPARQPGRPPAWPPSVHPFVHLRVRPNTPAFSVPIAESRMVGFIHPLNGRSAKGVNGSRVISIIKAACLDPLNTDWSPGR